MVASSEFPATASANAPTVSDETLHSLKFHQDILPSTDNDHAFSTALNGASHTSKSYGSTKKRSQPTLHVDAAGTLPPHPLPSSSNSDTHVQNGETQPLLRPAEDTSTHSSRSILWDYFLPFWIFSSLFRRPTSSSGSTLHRTKTIHRPRRSVTGIAQGGAHVLGGVRKFSPEVLHTEDEDNLPLIILGEMSGYLAVLERRGGTSGPVIGGLFTGIQGLEDALTGMEKIVTTPLPVCYAVHLRQTVWIYLLALPSQLVVSRSCIAAASELALIDFLASCTGTGWLLHHSYLTRRFVSFSRLVRTALRPFLRTGSSLHSFLQLGSRRRAVAPLRMGRERHQH